MPLVPIQVCNVCGRDLPPRGNRRGPTKQYHRECRELPVRLEQVRHLLRTIRFRPPARVEGSNAMLGHAKEIRSELQDVWRSFTVKSVKTATDDKEYYDD